MGLLRLLLAISVVVAHTGNMFGCKFVGGHLAVQAFYIISGFYMSLILTEKYIGTDGSFKLFISNRLLRLFPIYWLTLIVTVVLSVINYKLNHEGKLALYVQYYNTGQLNIFSLLFMGFTNLFLLFQDWVMFLGLDSAGNLFFTKNFRVTSPMLYTLFFIPQAWTIGVEITYYLIAPALVRRSLKILFPIIIACLALRGVLYMNGLDHDPWTYRFFPTELMFFLLGTVSYRLYNVIKNKESRNLEIALTGAMILATIFLEYLGPDVIKIPLYFILITVGIPHAFKLTKSIKADIFIGDLSYPVYITHILVYSLVGYRIKLFNNNAFTVTAATIVLSIIINELVSKRIEKYRQARVHRSIA